MRRTQYVHLGLVILLAFVASAVTAEAVARVATIEVKGMV